MNVKKLRELVGITTLAVTTTFPPTVRAAGADDGARYGERTYVDKCASCHGTDARGNGPVAEWLSLKPSNLRLLAKDNDDKYPFGRLYAIIEGRTAQGGEGVHGTVRGHGSRAMPVWGKHFSDDATFGSASVAETQVIVHGRILGLVYYLQTLQEV